MDCDTQDCSAVLVQGQGEGYRVVSMVGRELTPTERQGSLFERLLLTAAWGIRRLACFMLGLPAIVVVLPHPAAVGCTQPGACLPPRLQAHLVELSSFGCSYEVGDGAWAVGGAVPHLKSTEPDAKTSDVWEHEDIQLRRPEAAAKLPPDLIEGALRLHFDGACRRRQNQAVAAGGFIAWAGSGRCEGGCGLYYGEQVQTSNVAEARAAADAVTWLA